MRPLRTEAVGALFFNSRGQVIGVNEAYIDGFSGGTLGISVQALRPLIEAAKEEAVTRIESGCKLDLADHEVLTSRGRRLIHPVSRTCSSSKRCARAAMIPCLPK